MLISGYHHFMICSFKFRIILSMMKNKHRPDRKAKQLWDNISSLPASAHYFILMSCKQNSEHPKVTLIADVLPKLVVFASEDLAFREILNNVIKEEELKLNLVDIDIKLQSGFTLNLEDTPQRIRKELRRESINGLEIFLFLKYKTFEDEACLRTFIDSDHNFNRSEINVHVYLPSIDYHFYIPISHNLKFCGQITKNIAQQINNIFKTKVNPQILVITCYSAKQKILFKPKRLIVLCREDKIVVQFKQNLKLVKPKSMFDKVKLKIQGKQTNSKIFHYDDIRNLKIETLFKEKISFNDPKANPIAFGLRFFQITLKPYQKLADFPQIEKVLASFNNSSKILVADIISQTQLFLDHHQNHIKSDELQMPTLYSTLNMDQGRQLYFEQIVRERINSSKNELMKELTAIFLYTCQLQIEIDSKKTTLYHYINSYLRDLNFGTINRELYDKWNWMYIGQLINQSRLIEPLSSETTLYRGIGYSTNYKIGEVLLFKGFSSTSVSRNVALGFAKSALLILKRVSQAKLIKDFSYYPEEEEALIPPHTSFRVVKVTPSQKIFGKTLTVYEMEEIPHESLKKFTVVYILWVSGKKDEGHRLFAEVNPEKTTYLVELYSNEELQKWMNEPKHAQIIKDPTIQKILISNMTRMERQMENKQAGIDSIHIFRKYLPQSHIFMYIGWVQSALEKLSKHKLKESNILQVSNSEKKVISFMSERCKL